MAPRRIDETPRDLPSAEIIAQIDKILGESPTAHCYIKWTCPNCGVRVMATDKNAFHTGGYLHEECGHTYTGDLFGFTVIFGAERSEA